MLNKEDIKKRKLKGGKVTRLKYKNICVDVTEDPVYRKSYVAQVQGDPYPCYWGNKTRAVEAAYLLIQALKEDKNVKELQLGRDIPNEFGELTDFKGDWNCPIYRRKAV